MCESEIEAFSGVKRNLPHPSLSLLCLLCILFFSDWVFPHPASHCLWKTEILFYVMLQKCIFTFSKIGRLKIILQLVEDNNNFEILGQQ